MSFEYIAPDEIEKRSFEIISEKLKGRIIDEKEAPVIKRVIHTTADFDYADNLVFSPGVIDIAHDAIANGTPIITDTNMGKAGINKQKLRSFGGEVYCFMSDDDVSGMAKAGNTTRAWASMDKAAELGLNGIFAIGNAPTALIRLHELMEEGLIHPALIIGVPVGFVNVIEAKELILNDDVPYIIARGQKGGSNVAASICNALIYGVY